MTAEGGLRVLEKIFADRPIVPLICLVSDASKLLPAIFQHGVAIQVRPDSDSHQSSQWADAGPPLDWYELTESCDSILLKRGLKNRWYLPCVTARSERETCECPFIAHAPRADWEALHGALKTAKAQWLLTYCSLFVLVNGRAWLQICGPLDKGSLEKAYPLVFKSSASARKADKRKRTESPAPEVVLATAQPASSVQRPLKKIRLFSTDGQRQIVQLQPNEDVKNAASPSPSTLIPKLNKVRLLKRNALGQLECADSPTPNSPLPPETVEPPGRQSIKPEPAEPVRRGRSRRKKPSVRQIVDHRRALDGSLVIPRDGILYNGSGWTHFPITHPLNRSSPKEALSAITSTAVGSECDDHVELAKLEELVAVMGRNHRGCRYLAILGQILKSAPEYDRKTSSVTSERVYQFVKYVVKRIVPLEMLGGRDNQLTFLSNVRHFVLAGRGTSFTLNDLIQSMKTGKCRWLSHVSSLPLQVSLLTRVIKWLMLDWIKPLIRQHFYATETTYGRNRIFYFTKDVWQRMLGRMVKSMCNVSLQQPIASLEKSSDPSELNQLMLHSRLRFIPKKDGSRPIMSTTFRRANRKEVITARLLLQAISSLYPEGMDAKSTNNFHRQWSDFLLRRPCPHSLTYFVHADVQDAFGSINHDKLISILRWHGNCLPNELTARTLCVVTPAGRRSKGFTVIPHFQSADEWVRHLAPGSVILDLNLRHDKLTTAKELEFAIQSVREVHVAHSNPKQDYRLKRGIPQGSRLSSALCHIYYGHLVREHLTEWAHQPEDLFVRVVDDFLYLTSSGRRARSFYNRMHEGFPGYHARVNVNKTATNLDLERDGNEEGAHSSPLSKPPWPSFCGLQFNTKTLEIRGDYSKYHGTDIIDCITLPAGNPGKLLLHRVLATSTLKIQAMYLDSAVNRKPTVIRSMYHACLMAAFRFHAIVIHVLMRHRPRAILNPRFLALNVIKGCSTRMVGHVKSVRRRREVKVELTLAETAWLCYEAFVRKLRKHGRLYDKVLPTVKALQAEVEGKLDDKKLTNARRWIGKGIPRSFGLMKQRKPPRRRLIKAPCIVNKDEE